MSDPGPNSQVDAWLKQGIEAARAGDNATARTLLERVVEQDRRNERGWFWLAAVVDDIKEKKICLGNVLTVNPGNQRAQDLLQRLYAIEQGAGQPEQAGPSVPDEPERPVGEESPNATPTPPAADDLAGMPDTRDGSDSRAVWYIAAGLGAIASIVLLVVLVMMVGGDDGDGNDSSPADVGTNPTPTEDNSPGDGPPPAVQPTLPPDITPTPSRTPQPAPATWTPVPSNTPVPAVPPTVFPPLAANVSGKLIMRSGDVPGDADNQPIAIINPNGGNQQTLTGTDRGHAPSLSPDGSRIVFIKYAVGTREYLLQFDNLEGTAPQFGTDYWGRTAVLLDPDHPTWSPDGNLIAFTAKGGSATPDLYLVSLLDPSGNDPDALQRLTDDDAAESWPSFSPDGRFLVYAADLSQIDASGGTELRIYNLADRTYGDLTTNRANLIESAPDWSPDARQIVFQAREAANADVDIYTIPAVGGAAQKIIDSDFDDIQPRFSPDGRYLVFSSNRSGNWDVYIYEIATQTYYQVTSARQTDIANDWGS